MKRNLIGGLTLSASIFAFVGCTPPATNTTVNTNTNTNSVNSNMNMSNMNSANTNMSNTATGSAVDTKEPEKYSAKVRVSLEAIGDTQKMATPPLAADVARDGQSRRLEITLPNNEKLIYLDVNGKNLLISPNRKQFAELNKESVGVDIRSLLMPEQIVQRIKAQQGVTLVGEEDYNGRKANKYRYAATTNTQTQAGQVNTESFLLVDKETGLPLRSETVAASTGNVQGMKEARVVTEMSDISTTPAADLFAEPGADYKKVSAEEIRSQVNMLLQLAGAFVGQMLNQSAKPAQPTVNQTATPQASPSVSPTAK